MSGIRITGAAVAQQKAIDGKLKLTTFIPLKTHNRGGKRIIVQPDIGNGPIATRTGFRLTDAGRVVLSVPLATVIVGRTGREW
jgi:hypothetical protein